jgi:hypothetical protein
MQNWNRLPRALLFTSLLTGLLGGMLAPVLVDKPVSAAPMKQTPLCSSNTTFTWWTFDGATPQVPSIGSGTFSYGTGLSGLAYPAGQSGSAGDTAIRFSSWTTTSTYDPNDYVEFDVDTTGKGSIAITFLYRATSTGPLNLELYYSTDGTSFNTSGQIVALTRDSAWHASGFDLSSFITLNNNPNVKFKLYGYSAGQSSGTLSFDNVVFYCVPTVVIDSVIPNLTSSGTTITWHAYDNGAFFLRVGGTNCADGSVIINGVYPNSPSTESFGINAGNLAEGLNILRACVTDTLSNTGSAIGYVTKDTTAPGITSFTRQTPSSAATNADALIFRATFSEDVTGVDIADFMIHDNTPASNTTTIVTNVVLLAIACTM